MASRTIVRSVCREALCRDPAVGCTLSRIVNTPSSSSGRYDFMTTLQRSSFSVGCFQEKGRRTTHFKCAPINCSVMVWGKVEASVGAPHLGSRRYLVTASVSSKRVS